MNDGVGVAVWFVQQWAAPLLIGLLLFLAKHWAGQQEERAKHSEQCIHDLREHFDDCVQSIREELRANNTEVAELKEWRKSRDKDDDRWHEEWREHLRHINAQAEEATKSRHELGNRIHKIALKVTLLERASRVPPPE